MVQSGSSHSDAFTIGAGLRQGRILSNNQFAWYGGPTHSFVGVRTVTGARWKKGNCKKTNQLLEWPLNEPEWHKSFLKLQPFYSSHQIYVEYPARTRYVHDLVPHWMAEYLSLITTVAKKHKHFTATNHQPIAAITANMHTSHSILNIRKQSCCKTQAGRGTHWLPQKLAANRHYKKCEHIDFHYQEYSASWFVWWVHRAIWIGRVPGIRFCTSGTCMLTQQYVSIRRIVSNYSEWCWRLGLRIANLRWKPVRACVAGHPRHDWKPGIHGQTIGTFWHLTRNCGPIWGKIS